MIYILTAMLLIIVVLVIYIVASTRIKQRMYEKELEKDKALIIKNMKPADITPVVEEIKKSEDKRDAVKEIPVTNANDVATLLDTLNGRR